MQRTLQVWAVGLLAAATMTAYAVAAVLAWLS